MKTIVFTYNPYIGEHNAYIEEFEFEDDATKEEINEAWHDWIWEQIGDHVNWYEKE